ncbi:universal stress protein [Streptomyces sp. NPDC059467]|uniref:universal stress protein n=1 Tax=Streptomyces sp. NPDC059467 TaxID=3346844 RepID=UPI0036C47CE8
MPSPSQHSSSLASADREPHPLRFPARAAPSVGRWPPVADGPGPLADRGRAVDLVRGDAVDVLLPIAEGADVLAVGRGRGGFARVLPGSVGMQVSQHASRPVVIVCPEGA